MLNDPIADMLTRIRNAVQQEHSYVDMDMSNLKMEILFVLQEFGFVRNVLSNKDKKKIRVYLKYKANKDPYIRGLKRNSRPGRRIYVKSCQVPIVRNGFGISIISTSKGIMNGNMARKEKIGGEYICSVW